MRKLYSCAKKIRDKIPGGLADEMSPEDFDPKALSKGTKVETEHTSDRQIAEEIAMDHLEEDPKYYEKLEKMEGEKSHKELLPLIEKIKTEAKKSDTIKDMCKEYGVDISIIDVVPVAFDYLLDVSARTNKGCIYFNGALIDDFLDNHLHYFSHELTHVLQQWLGDSPTEGSTKDNYLDNEYEQEGFQTQTEYISETDGDEAAEKYIDKVLDHHDVPEKEKDEKREDLLSFAINLGFAIK